MLRVETPKVAGTLRVPSAGHWTIPRRDDRLQFDDPISGRRYAEHACYFDFFAASPRDEPPKSLARSAVSLRGSRRAPDNHVAMATSRNQHQCDSDVRLSRASNDSSRGSLALRARFSVATIPPWPIRLRASASPIVCGVNSPRYRTSVPFAHSWRFSPFGGSRGARS